MFSKSVFAAAIAVLVAGQSFAQSPRDATQPHPLVEPSLAKIQSAIGQGPFRAEWSSLQGYEIPQWYKDAKFGIFIHWGAYSVPAFGSEWYPRQMYINRDRRGDNFFQHHIDTYGPQKKFGYKDFIPQFKAEKFDAAEWAKLFKDEVLRRSPTGRTYPQRIAPSVTN